MVYNVKVIAPLFFFFLRPLRYSQVTLEALPAPSEVLLDVSEALLATSETLLGLWEALWIYPRLSQVDWRLLQDLEALPVPLRPFRSLGYYYPFHAMALSVASENLLTPSEVAEQPPRPSQLPLKPFQLPLRLFQLPPKLE